MSTTISTEDPPAFQEYPLFMTHPGYKPATLGRSPDERSPDPAKRAGSQGTPAKFLPVTVNNKDQEEYHLSLGYVRAGKGNPAAFVQAHVAPEVNAPRQDYPKWVGDKIARDEAHELELRAELEQMAAEETARQLREDEEARAAPTTGDVQDQIAELRDMVATLAKAVTAPAVAPPPASVDGVRAMFLERATKAGVTVDGRWSLERLIAAVAEAEGAKG